MRGFLMQPRKTPGQLAPITWQQMPQQLERQMRQQQVLERLQQAQGQQELRLLLFCRKRTEQQQR